MSQYDGTESAPAVYPGATALADITKLAGHVLSGGSGATRPTNLQAGGLWSKNLGGGAYELYFYDGTSDLLVRGTDPVPGDFTTITATNIAATRIGLGLGFLTGSVIWHAADTPPAGTLECDGSTISRTTYSALFAAIGTTYGAGDGSTTFAIPDYRGEFIRGWDHGRGVDSGRAFGSSQGHAIQSHTHTHETYLQWQDNMQSTGGALTNFWRGTDTDNTGSTGGSETRPRNVAALPCIIY